MFLNEGIKIYFRMAYATFRTLKNEILSTNDSSTLKSLIRKHTLKMNSR